MKRAAAILFTDGKALLLLKRAGDGNHIGTWALPGGKGEGKESEIGNAVRETMEETGLETIPGFRFDSVTTSDSGRKFTTFFYKVKSPFDITLSKEHSDWDWVAFKDLPDTELHPKLRDAMPECLRRIRKKVKTFGEWSMLEGVIRHLSR